MLYKKAINGQIKHAVLY